MKQCSIRFSQRSTADEFHSKSMKNVGIELGKEKLSSRFKRKRKRKDKWILPEPRD